MKFGLLYEYDTRNIGDDVQSYATRRFLPRVDYLVDRNHIDEFMPEKEEKVATIMNGWFLQYTLNWPPSPYIKPLLVSMHFTYKDWFWDTTDRAYHLQGYGLEYLKQKEPIGCRDSHTMKLLNEKGVKTEYTGCMTLTLEPFEGIEKQDYICAVDVSEEVVNRIRETTDMEVKVVTHIVPEDYYKLSWEERMKNVEELLKLYQGARAVISYRLHCALPCLALGTPTILLNEEYRNDRFGDYTKYIESCDERDFVSGKVKYDYRNIPVHSDEWKELRENLIKRCQKFVEENKDKSEDVAESMIKIKDYSKYVISKSNWLKEATLESYQRFQSEKESGAVNKRLLEKQIDEKAVLIEEKEKMIQEKDYEIEYYKKEFNYCVSKLEESQKELAQIKNSRWWKLRNKIKKVKEKEQKNEKNGGERNG